MAYENLALKYRPQKFEEIVGQDAVVKTLTNALNLNKIAHAYLFYGPRGCGKTSIARILSKSLNCHKPEKHTPCNKCPSCLEISRSASMDVIEIDAASHTQVQNVRDVIIDNVNLSPSRDKYKIYILDEVHMLSNSAFNALLKTIEEPPPHIVFIMATTEINKVPLTIVSRCQTFRFRPMSAETIVHRLEDICKKEGISYEENALKLIADSASGAMRDAITILDRVSTFSEKKISFNDVAALLGHPPFELIKSLYEAIISRDVNKVHNTFIEINSQGYETLTILKDLRNAFAQSFLTAHGFKKEHSLEIKDINPFVFAKLSRKLNRIIEEVKFSDNPSLVAETAIYTIMDIPLDIASLVQKLEKTEFQAFENYGVGNIDQKKNFSYKENSINKNALPGEKDNKAEESLDYSSLWQKFLTNISKEKITLYNFLIDSDITFTEKEWKIALDSEFKRNIVEKNIEFLKEILKKSGIDVKLSLELAKKEEKMEEISLKLEEKTISEDESKNIQWVDIDNSGEEFPELKKIQKIFGDRIKKITRIEKVSKNENI